MPDLDAPLGAPGTLVVQELMDAAWRHAPDPRRAATLLDAELPTGRLVLRCNEAVDEVTATLDGEPVGRLHERALRRQGLMWDGAPGPGVELGDRTGTLTWRMQGSKLRPLGRLRWFQVELDGASYSYWMQGLLMHLARSPTPDGEDVVLIGAGGVDGRDRSRITVKEIGELDRSRHSVRWEAGTTTADLVLAELLTLGMATLDLWSLPGKLVNQAVRGRDG